MVDVSVFKSLAAASPILQPRKLDFERPSWQFFQAWLLRECSALPSERILSFLRQELMRLLTVWLFAMTSNEVSWRGDRVYRVRMDGKVVEQVQSKRGYAVVDNNVI